MKLSEFQKEIINAIIDSQIKDLKTFLYHNSNLEEEVTEYYFLRSVETRSNWNNPGDTEHNRLFRIKNAKVLLDRLREYSELIEFLEDNKLILIKKEDRKYVIKLNCVNVRDNGFRDDINLLLKNIRSYHISFSNELKGYKERKYITEEESKYRNNKRLKIINIVIAVIGLPFIGLLFLYLWNQIVQ
ncbi:MAG: hypothetical protein NTV87_12690 [Ignavibacteriae bacterium]|nr:hypothetical protein [Ignavibacteriota bacterium]